MHLVGFGLEPGEETARAVPDLLLPRAFALDHPLTRLLGQIAPRHIDRNAALPGEAQQVVLAFLVGWRLPGPHRARGQRFAVVGNDQAVVDADHAAEATAGVAGADRGIEREQA